MTPAHERKAKERQRRKDAGEVRLEFWIPADKAEAVRAAVALALETLMEVSEVSELKTCPFCGNSAYGDEGTAMVFGTRTGHNFAIACRNCEVSGPGEDTFSAAVAAWNARVNSQS